MKSSLRGGFLALYMLCLAPWQVAQAQPPTPPPKETKEPKPTARYTPSGLPITDGKAPSTADASPKKAKKEEAPFHLSAEARTDVPVLMGGHFALEFQGGFRITSTIGILPPFYLDMLNGVLVSAKAYSPQTGDLIRGSLSSSMVWRIHLGWRHKLGFYLEAGYGLVTLGGHSSTDALLSAATGTTLPPQLKGRVGQYEIHSTLHMIDAELGWIFSFADDHLFFRLAVGFAGTLASQTTVTPTVPNAIAQQFAGKSAAYLDNLYQSYVFTPTVTLGFGYRFF